MNRQTTIQTDGGEVHFTYWPTGELRKKWGARKYPSETTYDEQGRMKTLTTWQDYPGSTGAAVTTWIYNPVSGQLTQKLYADNQANNGDGQQWGRTYATNYAINSKLNLDHQKWP